MKALCFREYGPPDVLHMEEVPRPIPKDKEILVRVRATPVNYGDLIGRRFAQLPLREFNMPSLLYLPARLMLGWSRPR